MKKNNFLLLVIIIMLSVGCQNSGSSAPTAEAVQEGDYQITDYRFGGLKKAIKNSEQGELIEEGDMLNGKKTGSWLTYHKGTNIKHIPETIVNYHDGVLHGVALKFDKTSNLTEKAFYVNGVLEGKMINYKRSKIVGETDYKNGKIDGVRKLYYDSGTAYGKIKEEGTFKNGKRDGYAKWYDQEGKVMFEYQYKDGKKTE